MEKLFSSRLLHTHCKTARTYIFFVFFPLRNADSTLPFAQNRILYTIQIIRQAKAQKLALYTLNQYSEEMRKGMHRKSKTAQTRKE